MYVGEWIEHDRAAGIPIDPRAVAYANGERSPFEALRAIPQTWLATKRERDWLEVGALEAELQRRERDRLRQELFRSISRRLSRVVDFGRPGWVVDSQYMDNRSCWDEARDWVKYAADHVLNGLLMSAFFITAGSTFGCQPDWCSPQNEMPSLHHWALALMGAIIWANIATLARVLRSEIGPERRRVQSHWLG
jgi:hypothetical protein